jgi:hypothetical protein
MEDRKSTENPLTKTTGDDRVVSLAMSTLQQKEYSFCTPCTGAYNAREEYTKHDEYDVECTQEDANTVEGLYAEPYSQELSQLTSGNDYSQYSIEQSQYLPGQSFNCSFTQESCKSCTSPMKNQKEFEENNN